MKSLLNYFIIFFFSILDLPFKKNKQINKPSKLHDQNLHMVKLADGDLSTGNYSLLRFSVFFFSETLVSGLRFICLS